jgi:hypothetical protein
MSYYYGYYEEEPEMTEETWVEEEEVAGEAQPIAFVIQPVAALLGIGYGTYNFLDLYSDASDNDTEDFGLLFASLLGWANAASAALWFVMPETIVGPALGAGLNLVAAIWPYLDDGYEGAAFSDIWYIPTLAAAALAIDVMGIMAVMAESSSGDDDMEDYGEEEVEGDAEEACDPYYDYYCY